MRTITILIDTTPPKRSQVDAEVFGQWAAHRSFTRLGWSVTHVPSGMCIPTREITEAEARRLAGMLQGITVSVDDLDGRQLPADEARRVAAILRELDLHRGEA